MVAALSAFSTLKAGLQWLQDMEQYGMRLKTIASALLCASAVILPSAEASETFHAMCGQENERCTIQGTGEAIYLPGVTITPESIIGWTMSDTTQKYQQCTLFGCYEYNYGKRENFDFSIKYLDTSNVRQIVQFKFLNERPAKRMANFLSLFSDLQSGEIAGTTRSQTRSTANQTASAIPQGTPLDTRAANPSTPIPSHLKATHTPGVADFKNAPKGRKSWSQALKENPELAIWAAQNPEDAARLKAAKYSDKPEITRRSIGTKRKCKEPLKKYNCNWSEFLDDNPKIKAWAEANPIAAMEEKIRLGGYDEDSNQLKNFESLGKPNSSSSKRREKEECTRLMQNRHMC